MKSLTLLFYIMHKKYISNNFYNDWDKILTKLIYKILILFKYFLYKRIIKEIYSLFHKFSRQNKYIK